MIIYQFLSRCVLSSYWLRRRLLLAPVVHFNVLQETWEVDGRRNGPVMDEGLTRPQMGLATSGTWVVHLKPCAFSTLEGVGGHQLASLAAPRRVCAPLLGRCIWLPLRSASLCWACGCWWPQQVQDCMRSGPLCLCVCSFLNERSFFFFLVGAGGLCCVPCGVLVPWPGV